jgi:hypothetical protein
MGSAESTAPESQARRNNARELAARAAMLCGVSVSSRVIAGVLALVAVLGCEGQLVGTRRPDGGSGRDAFVEPRDLGALVDTGVPPVDAGGAPVDGGPLLRDFGVEPGFDAGACGAGGLASRLTFVDVAGAGGGMRAYPTSTGGAAVAFQGGAGVGVVRLDASGAVFGARVDVSGDGLWGVAAGGASIAVLVSRGDELLLVVTAGGAVTHEERLLGAVPHDVTNNEWFGDLLRAGRVDFDGTGWVTYSTVQRLWPDGVAHYGDTLRSYTLAGAPSGVSWDWGCSHSMEVRLAQGRGTAGAVCSSDCYPGKGVFFEHNTQIFLDASGNCAGYVAQRLGGVAPVADGVWIAWTSAEGRASSDPAIAHVVGGAPGAPLWLSADAGDATDMHLAPYGSGLVVGWNEGGVGHLTTLDAAGAIVGAVEPIDAGVLAGADDFFVYAGGDVGFASGSRLARLRACP